LLGIGDIVPADCTVLWTKDLHVDESSLTGESFPVQKNKGDDMFMATTVVNGEAIVSVVNIGKSTKFGHIAEKLLQKKPETDFQKGLKQFGYLIVQLTLVLVIVIFFLNALLRHDILQSLLFSLALAVGLTPELLPMIVTVNLAKGATRMAKKGVIVKHLPSIQNFGSMNILCTDKTGTLTENTIKLERYEDFTQTENKRVLSLVYINSFFQSNSKNPLDEAILQHKEVHPHGFEKIDEIPFDFIRKRLSVVVHHNKETLLVCKGAPEDLFDNSTHVENRGKIVSFDKKLKEKVINRYEKLSNDGYRVLAVAYKKVAAKNTYGKNDEKDLVFMGLTAFLDPPKQAAKEVIKSLTNDGVTLKILTGDSELVTKKICEELDIPVQSIVTGKQLLHVTQSALPALVLKGTIFARLTPDQKDRIIIALKASGNVVGYMGDGINDASALKTADIGISVDNAVDVAKESSDLILVTKSLRVLQDGIIEGRRTFANSIKYIFMGTGSNFGNMFSVSIASLFLPFLPMLPIQILVNNLLYDVSQLALPTDNVDKEDIKAPLRWDMHFIKRFVLTFGPISSLFDIITFVSLLTFFHASIPVFRTGWFVESAITQALIILTIRTKKVPFYKSRPSQLLIVGAVIATISSIVLSQSSLGTLFQFTSLPSNFWLFIAGIVISYFVVIEITKIVFYKRTVEP
jgi:Mg2+-importing ATPase